MKTKHLLPALAALAMTACTSIDCSLDSVVVWTLTFCDSKTEEPVKLPCSLTIDADGAGTLFNKGINISSMELPMSNTNEEDKLYLSWSLGNGSDETAPYTATDVLTISHTNYGHFDAMDCPAAVFHTITGVKIESREAGNPFPIAIDSVSIIRSKVDYQDVENIRLYLNIPASAESFRSISR